MATGLFGFIITGWLGLGWVKVGSGLSWFSVGSDLVWIGLGLARLKLISLEGSGSGIVEWWSLGSDVRLGSTPFRLV